MTAVPSEKRLVFRVLAQWRDRRAERSMPEPGELSADDLGADEASCFFLSLPLDGGAARFTHLGAAFHDLYGDLIGRALGECHQDTLLGAATSCLGEMLERRVPVCIGGLSRNAGGPVLFRSILLPLSSDGHRIDTVLGAVNFRVVEGSVGLESK